MTAPLSPCSAYLHVPFCAHRCGYCNFAVIAGRDDLSAAYLQAVEREMFTQGPPRRVDTLYFGGGTPTRLSLRELQKLCRLARRWRPPDQGCEWTVEANPGDVSAELLDVLVAQGVTRLSLGGQSFRTEKLRLLERDHDPDDLRKAVALCRERVVSVALDLIFAAPGESLADWQRDLQQAVDLEPDHLSTYGLTFEKGTAFWSRRYKDELKEVGEEVQRDMYVMAIEALTSHRYEHYEVSNFARPGRRSRHNEAYWSGAEYDAVGPGACRYVGGVRETNHRSTTTYLQRVLNGLSPVAEREKLSPEARARERLVFGLRRLQGVSRQRFAAETGFEIDELAGHAIEKHCELGLLQADATCVRLTRQGLLVSDGIWPDLL